MRKQRAPRGILQKGFSNCPTDILRGKGVQTAAEEECSV